MQAISMSSRSGAGAKLVSKLIGLSRDENGTTAIEFAAVAAPFFMFVFGIIGISMHYFVMNSLEKGMDQASRMIRTGQAQTQAWTVEEFENYICNKANSANVADAKATAADGHIKCGDIQVFLQKRTNWDQIQPEPCVNVDGTKRVNTTNKADLLADHTGTANDVVVVTTCYEWQFTKKIPFLKFDTANGAMIMQSATAFRTEPYAAVSSP